jgi:hypothetical protein
VSQRISQAFAWLALTQDLWKNVDIDEAVEIRDWLMDDKRGLNITRSHEAGER